MSVAYGIIRVQKVKRTAVSSMQYHNDRLPGEHSNPNIDPARTRDNVELVDHGDYRDEVAMRIERFRTSSRKVRKDAVVLVEGIVTASPEFFAGKGRDEVVAYFRDAYEFVRDEAGAQNLVHFTVHMDEETPHAHFGFTPIKDGSLSCKRFFPGRASFSQFQDRFFERVSGRYGLERGVKGTGRRHKDAAEMMRDQEREIRRGEAAIEAAAREYARERARADEARREREAEERLRDVARAERVDEQRRLESVQGLANYAQRLADACGTREGRRALAAEAAGARGRIGQLERALEQLRELRRRG